MQEEWKPVVGYEGLYEVSNFGRIKAFQKTVNKGKCHRSWDEHFLKYGVDGCGYYRTNLAKNGMNRTVKVHRLVAEAFIPNPEGKPEVNHVDGNKQNNHVSNLEWCTHGENQNHAYRIGLKSVDGSKNPAHKLTDEEVDFIRKNYIPRHPEFGTVALSKKFGVHRKTISRITCGNSWKVGENHV